MGGAISRESLDALASRMRQVTGLLQELRTQQAASAWRYFRQRAVECMSALLAELEVMRNDLLAQEKAGREEVD